MLNVLCALQCRNTVSIQCIYDNCHPAWSLIPKDGRTNENIRTGHWHRKSMLMEAWTPHSPTSAWGYAHAFYNEGIIRQWFGILFWTVFIWLYSDARARSANDVSLIYQIQWKTPCSYDLISSYRLVTFLHMDMPLYSKCQKITVTVRLHFCIKI